MIKTFHFVLELWIFCTFFKKLIFKGASAAPAPKVNVWEERKSKQEAIKALEPQNEYDEEAMLQHALAMSLLEEEKRKEEEKRLKYVFKLFWIFIQN